MAIIQQADGSIVEVSPVKRENITAYVDRLKERKTQLNDELTKVEEALVSAEADLVTYDKLNPAEAAAAAPEVAGSKSTTAPVIDAPTAQTTADQSAKAEVVSSTPAETTQPAPVTAAPTAPATPAS